MERFTIKIAGLYFQCQSGSHRIQLDKQGSVRHYLSQDSVISPDYFLEYTVVHSLDLSNYEPVFAGKPEANEALNYKWHVYNSKGKVVVTVDYTDHPHIQTITAFVVDNDTTINIQIVLKDALDKSVVIDPFIHPLGSLLMLYLMQRKKGLLIHASAVAVDGKAFLFTGVSGIGKSTMARLWRECGAQILNDDRLVLRPFEDEVRVYNNPMPYYAQHPREASLKAIFLLKQSPQNYIQPLGGVLAYSRVLGNFIQQFYQQQMVQNHLGLVEEVLNKVKVYEVGFKPDHDIVAMIKGMDGE
ncbi:hypothetical protein SAMN06265379_1065 [Saccharicrinis carchari]|uniref:Hpr(Ser) kinase/phosphatase n=1 Tax=Saccharicrinis carchari TaxID=1168039 RepID=A0A521DM10_SACCC|nr:hypothetical protein [Saccharicrinis carchari]SMO72737.1 hypothetical protein SAMN06265379_1065 [Saccharicrinis carchari]